MDILTRLQREWETLSSSEQRIAELLFSNFDFAVNASIVTLAARAEVSPPTVTRFARRLGCQSFSDFKVQLAQTVFVGTRYLRPETSAVSAADIAENVIAKAQAALFSLHQALDPAALEEASNRLSSAQMVYAFGSGGNSSMIAGEIQNRLFRLGLRVTASSDHALQLMMTAASRPGDVLIGSSFSGRNAELVRAFELARDNGIFTLALTRSGSPLAGAAQLTIGVDLPEGRDIFRPTATRLAYLVLVDILANLTAVRLGEQATDTLRRIKQQLVLHRDGDDTQVLGD